MNETVIHLILSLAIVLIVWAITAVIAMLTNHTFSETFDGILLGFVAANTADVIIRSVGDRDEDG